MPSFGFSAYLKLVCSNDRPQFSQVKKRLAPSEGGYDFHRSLRLLARQMLIDGLSLASAVEAADAIPKDSERNSAKSGLATLYRWARFSRPQFFEVQLSTYESPGRRFRVSFEPDFGTLIAGRRTAVHLWNTKEPLLQRHQVLGALAIASQGYRQSGDVSDVAVLSLRDSTLYSLSDATDQREVLQFGTAVAAAIDRLFERGARELGISIGPRPPAPPLPPPPPPPPRS
jgi:hypothetical protein